MSDTQEGRDARQTSEPFQSRFLLNKASELYLKFREYRTRKKQEAADDPAGHKTAVATVWIAVFTAILGGVAFLQYRVLQQTDETARTTNRAFVYFDNVRIVSNADASGAPVYAAVVTILNNGVTPAEELQAIVDCTLDPKKSADDPFLLPRKQNHSPGRMFLGPKQTATYIGCHLTQAEFDQIQEGEIFGYVVAEALYRDVFDPARQRTTRLLHRILIDKDSLTNSAPVGEKHNCADKDCPKYAYPRPQTDFTSRPPLPPSIIFTPSMPATPSIIGLPQPK